MSEYWIIEHRGIDSTESDWEFCAVRKSEQKAIEFIQSHDWDSDEILRLRQFVPALLTIAAERREEPIKKKEKSKP